MGMFDPNQLRYDANGIPILGPSEIESVANELLGLYCPSVLKSPRYTPVVEIIDRLCHRTKLKFEMRDLGFFKGSKVLGCVSLKSRILSLDTLLNGERKMSFRFTAAHEIGHWVLHRQNFRNWKLGETGETGDLVDDEKTLHRLSQKTPREWLEYQANVFASCLVLPRKMFIRALEDQQADMGIRRNKGQVYLTAAYYSRNDYHELQTRLGTIFDVSVTSVRVRVETLKLLRDEINNQARSPESELAAKEMGELMGKVLPRN